MNMTLKRMLVVACLLTVALAVPVSAEAAATVPMKCAVKGQLLPSTSIIERGNISYACTSTYLGTSPAICSGTIAGTATSGTCTRGMLTVVSCKFGGTFIRGSATSTPGWKGQLKVACGLPGMPPPRVDCYGAGGGAISNTGAISGTLTGYCEIPGTQ